MATKAASQDASGSGKEPDSLFGPAVHDALSRFQFGKEKQWRSI
jgi:hypothetical protein